MALINNRWPGAHGERLTARMNKTRLEDVKDKKTGLPGINPETGDVQKREVSNRRAGYDFTLSVPKSVSLYLARSRTGWKPRFEMSLSRIGEERDHLFPDSSPTLHDWGEFFAPWALSKLFQPFDRQFGRLRVIDTLRFWLGLPDDALSIAERQ